MHYIKYWSNMDKLTITDKDEKRHSLNLTDHSLDSFHIITDQPQVKSVTENFTMYSVTKDDTIERVAAKFKMTPNELISLNKMHSRTLFINQTLKVNKCEETECNSLQTIVGEGCTNEKKRLELLKKNVDSSTENILLPLHYKDNYLKLVSKYITDSQGIIKGKILLTPAFFTFMPAFSDPVVIEYGDDNYTVHLPNNKIECISMYNDSNMMTYKRSQRTDMLNDFPHSTNIENNNTETDEEPGPCIHLSHNKNCVFERTIRDHPRSYSMNDVLGQSMCVNDIERSQNSKFVDHKYLCVVASPRYRKIKAVSQKDDEYWFIVPTSSAQPLMDYFLSHAQTKCDVGSDLELHPDESCIETLTTNASFAKVEDVVGPLVKIKNTVDHALKFLRSKSIDWEIVNTDIDIKLNSFEESEEVESKIVDSVKVKELMKHLPSETIGATWELIYSTDRDGWSLATLYRNVYNSTRGCCLLLIKDSNSMVFGAMCNNYIRMSTSFYGNGTTFVFRWNPNFEKFAFSHRNNYILFGQPDYFSIGCSNCKNAIRIEKDLFSGVTQECDTFDSPPLVTSEDFVVKHLEVWSFY